MTVGVIKETYRGEHTVALVPAAVPSIKKAGLEVVVEKGAGEQAGYPDSVFADKGARIAATREEVFQSAEVILKVRACKADMDAACADVKHVRRGQVVIGFFDPLAAPDKVREIAASGVTSFSMELMPRITRAQSMDALSSMATVAGYKAVLLAADHLPRMFPMLMTAAGTVAPARVLVIGAGVAGLQAIATARRLGGVVQAYDVRPAVKDQVVSVGARFVELPLETAETEDKGGYAKGQEESFYRRQRDLMMRVVTESDVVITTAAVPGQKAPLLITGDMVAGMAGGSVIVDVAAERGGNCELTKPGETIIEHGVTIVGITNLPAMIPYHASQLYAKNISSFLLHIVKDGKIDLDSDDAILRETLLTRDGEVVHERVRELAGAEGKES